MRLLLAVAAALLLLRVVVVPWVAAQAEQRQRLQVLTQRLDRSIGVVGNREQILAARGKLTGEAAQVVQRFPESADEEAFRLELQRSVAVLAAGTDVTVGLFDWLLSGEIEHAGLAQGRVRVRLEGELQDLVRAHGELEAQLPHVNVLEWSLEPRNPVAGPDATAAAAVFVMDVHFRPAVGMTGKGKAS